MKRCFSFILFLVFSLFIFNIDNPIKASSELSKDSIKVLGIGNSFSDNGTKYLYHAFKALGVEDVITANVWIGGTNFTNHYNNVKLNTSSYMYDKNSTGNIDYQGGKTLQYALQDEEWDYVILTCTSYSPIVGYDIEALNFLIDYIHDNVNNSNVQIGFQATWADHKDSLNSAFTYYDYDQIRMYEACLNSANEIIAPVEGIDFIIYSVTAIQNGRTSYYGDNFTADGHHLNKVGEFLAGLTWALTISNWSVDDLNIELVPIQFQTDIEMIIAAATSAIDNPNFVTDLSHIKLPDGPTKSVLDCSYLGGNNLLNDSSFENPGSVDFAGDVKEITKTWKSVSWAGTDVNLGSGYSGQNNGYIITSHPDMPAGENAGFYQDVEVKKNTYYVIDMFVHKFSNDYTPDLFVGYRNPLSSDPWIYEDVTTYSNIGEGWEERYSVIYSGDNNLIRIALHADSYINDNSVITGYHIDCVRLYETKKIEDVRVSLFENIKVGENIRSFIQVKYNNEDDYKLIKPNEYVSLTFDVEDQTIIQSDVNANLIALNNGKTVVTPTLTIFGKKYKCNPIIVDVQNDSSYINPIDEVSINLDKEMSLYDYSQIQVSVRLNDGSYLSESDYELMLSSTNTDVCYIREDKPYVLIGVGKGEARVYATVDYNGYIGIGYIDVALETNNYLIDPSFEAQNDAWSLIGTSGGGFDNLKTNGYARTGYGNIWLMAPVYWDKNIKPDSEITLSQNVYLEEGRYSFISYINRFYATGTNGVLSGVGGVVTLGVVETDENGKEIGPSITQEFDTSYGNNVYGKISLVFDVNHCGNYKVYIHVEGDKNLGLGMQIDDVSLTKAEYPVSIKATYGQDSIEVDDFYKIMVYAVYSDGTEELLLSDIRYLFSDYKVACESKGFLIGRTPGSSDILIKAQVLDRIYETTISVTVNGDIVLNEINNQKPLFIWITIGILIASAISVSTILIIKKTKGGR